LIKTGEWYLPDPDLGQWAHERCILIDYEE
jgi:hypothetical protein